MVPGLVNVSRRITKNNATTRRANIKSVLVFILLSGWIFNHKRRGLLDLHAGEADEVGTETEASALASRHTDGRGDEVKHGENGRGDEGERGDFIEGEGLAGDEDGRTSNDEAFDQILDSTVDNFRDVHCSYIQN